MFSMSIPKLSSQSCLLTPSLAQKEETSEKSGQEPRFRFPQGYVITLSSGKSIDVSGVDVCLSGIFKGGIGYGASAAKLMAQTMKEIGGRGGVYNLPLSIQGALDVPEEYCKLAMISVQNLEVPESKVRELIADAIEKGASHINIPIDLDGHASLVSLVISEDKASLRFYDSLSSKIMPYEKRYSERLCAYIGSLVPNSIHLIAEKPQVLHLLDQGNEVSTGCGYYTLYTALLLKEEETIRNRSSFEGEPLLSEADDKKIRADLIVRTLLEHGVNNVDTSILEICRERRDHLFNRIDFTIRGLIQQLQPKLC